MMRTLARCAILWGWLVLLDTRASGGVIYVDAGATGLNDGSSWQDAYVDLKSGLGRAVGGDEIWVAAGTYVPGTSPSTTFQLKPSVTLYGGFRGGETTRFQRDPETNVTTLTGRNVSYHVVKGANGAIMDGFTITQGSASGTGPDEDVGGGLQGMGGTIVRDCRFVDNYAVYGGAGANNAGTFVRCLFENNVAPGSSIVGDSQGGATRNGGPYVDCVFRNNEASAGGAIYTNIAIPTLTGCVFQGNTAIQGPYSYAPGDGGAVYLSSGGTVTSCRFVGNTAGGGGGAIWSNSGLMVLSSSFDGNIAGEGGGFQGMGAYASFLNCTFTQNQATKGGAAFVGPGGCDFVGCSFYGNKPNATNISMDPIDTVNIRNSVLWGDSAGEISLVQGNLYVTYSDIQAGWAGAGNIDADPRYANSGSGDLKLLSGSPCIDAADNASIPPDSLDLDGDGDITEPLPFDLSGAVRQFDDPATPDTGSGTPPIVDMGAHEHTGRRTGNVIAGMGFGSIDPPRVRVYDAAGLPTTVDFYAYATGRWGVNVGSGDVDGGAYDEILTGPGPSPVFGPTVKGFRRDGSPIAKISFYAYATLRYGVGDTGAMMDGDAYDEILTGAGPGAVFGPHVRGFDFDAVQVQAMSKISFFAYQTLKYGVNVSQGDVDRDGFEELLTGPGPGVVFGPLVRGFDYDALAVTDIAKIYFWAFSTAGYGVRISGGDVDGDGYGEIVAAPGPGGSASYPARFRGFGYDGSSVGVLPGFDGTPFSGLGYGGRIGMGDLDSDGTDDVYAGSGPDPTALSTVKPYRYDRASLSFAGRVFTPFGAVGYGVHPAGAALGY